MNNFSGHVYLSEFIIHVHISVNGLSYEYTNLSGNMKMNAKGYMSSLACV